MNRDGVGIWKRKQPQVILGEWQMYQADIQNSAQGGLIFFFSFFSFFLHHKWKDLVQTPLKKKSPKRKQQVTFSFKNPSLMHNYPNSSIPRRHLLSRFSRNDSKNKKKINNNNKKKISQLAARHQEKSNIPIPKHPGGKTKQTKKTKPTNKKTKEWLHLLPQLVLFRIFFFLFSSNFVGFLLFSHINS